MLFCSIKGANRGYIQVLLATSRNRIYFRRRSNQFQDGPGQPPLPIRLVIGLLMLSHMCGLSDIQVVTQWIDRPYWQYFFGYEYFQWKLPCDPSSLTRWRKRLDEEGLNKMLAMTFR